MKTFIEAADCIGKTITKIDQICEFDEGFVIQFSDGTYTSFLIYEEYSDKTISNKDASAPDDWLFPIKELVNIGIYDQSALDNYHALKENKLKKEQERFKEERRQQYEKLKMEFENPNE